MSPQDEQKSSWLVPGRYPAPGASPIADAIRARRGERGLTPLDGTLLHVPPVAAGWNTLLGAVRTAGRLPDDVRELMILRVAAVNRAKFEWIHHEHVGRSAGLTTDQLYIVRDTTSPLPPPTGVLSPLQAAALGFADQSTRNVTVDRDVSSWLRDELTTWVATKEPGDSAAMKDLVEDLLVEASAIVATYNMVSRFLVSLDVAGVSLDPVPWPLERTEHFVSFPSPTNESYKIHAVTLIHDPSAPWLAFANSLITNLTMWDLLVPYILKSSRRYNILLFSQRGHGQSTTPGEGHPKTTIAGLAQDLHELLARLSIPTPIHAVIGVSQGGAVALSFATQFPTAARAIVACDTGPRTPAGNAQAWEERIQLVCGGTALSGDPEAVREDYAQHIGMGKLADVTVPRWFPSGSSCYPDPDVPKSVASAVYHHRSSWAHQMISTTPVRGFMAGARALGDYDILADGLFDSKVEKVLLVAGELDGGGKVGAGLQKLRDEWNPKRGDKAPVEYVSLPGSGHLPMLDKVEEFAKSLLGWLEGV